MPAAQEYLAGLQGEYRCVQGGATAGALALAAQGAREAKLAAKLAVLRSVVAAVDVTPEEVCAA